MGLPLSPNFTKSRLESHKMETQPLPLKHWDCYGSDLWSVGREETAGWIAEVV
jgi:hypothetical protein